MAIRKWQELSTADFSAMAKEHTLVILPIGSMEQHGPHMPVSTDSLVIEAVVNDVVGQICDLDALVLPTIWCAKSNEHVAFPGTIFLSV